MLRRLCTGLYGLASAALLLTLTACSKAPDADPIRMRGATTHAPAPPVNAELSADAAAEAEPVETAQRFLALKYHWTVENDADALEASWKRVNESCLRLACEILDSSFARNRDGYPPQGMLHARIKPSAVVSLMQASEQSGTVIANRMSSEDKTAAVIDTEARIKNMTELRDRLRVMLRDRTGSIKDVLEVERELSSVQAQIDALQGTRAALAAETEKNEITIEFVARSRFVDGQKTSPLRQAWDSVAEVFLSSVGSLLLFVAAVAPWLVVALPVLWLLRLVWRKRRERRGAK